MNSKKIFLLSPVAYKSDKNQNILLIEKYLIKYQTSDLFVFPELNVIGGLWKNANDDYKRLAEEVPSGESCKRIVGLAQKYQTTICSGVVEIDKDKNEHFITHFLCGPNGFIGKQRKLFPNAKKEYSFFSSGNKLALFNLWGYKVAILACADILLPEPTILTGIAGVSLIIAPTDCFGIDQQNIVCTLLQARALDTGAFVIGAFGHDHDNYQYPDSEVLATIFCDPNNPKNINLKKRKITKSKVAEVDISLKNPIFRHLGFEERSKIVLSKDVYSKLDHDNSISFCEGAIIE
ncbi:MAG: carbon-nitrogen hydrolase family protein [Oligoflexia bacterium]|nr:carbon-nitrogen hydrolase family protein [Oligoflexia bacterium]